MTYKVPSIQIHDELASVLGGPVEIETFSISLMDAAKLSGHLCPSVAGAFLVTSAAVKSLFPDGICQRGLLSIEMPGGESEGANGPMGHVISYITGAWTESGFGGLRGQHVRKNLLKFNSPRLTNGQFRFERTDTKKAVIVSYLPNRARTTPSDDPSFGALWQQRVRDILACPESIEILEEP